MTSRVNFDHTSLLGKRIKMIHRTGGAEHIAAANSDSRPKPAPTQTDEAPTPGMGKNGSISVYPKELFMSPLDNDDQIDELSEGEYVVAVF